MLGRAIVTTAFGLLTKQGAKTGLTMASHRPQKARESQVVAAWSAARWLRRRIMAPTPPNPTIIMAQAEGSGTAPPPPVSGGMARNDTSSSANQPESTIGWPVRLLICWLIVRLERPVK